MKEHECKSQEHGGDGEYTPAGARCLNGTSDGADEDERTKGENNHLIDGDIEC